MTQCYQLIDVVCKGQQLQARPVEWDREDYTGFGKDRKGTEVKAVGFHTTCPNCGNLIAFKSTELYVGKNKSENNVKCGQCHYGTDKQDVVKEDKSVVHKIAKLKVEVVEPTIEPVVAAFRDPIADGLFDEDVNFELLKELDTAQGQRDHGIVS